MKFLKKSILASSLVLILNTHVSAATFDGIVIFGDSLSDSGAYTGNADVGMGGRFTTNPGPVWVETLGAYYGLDVVSNNPNNPNTSATGNNYAQGGAQVFTAIGIGQSASPQSAQPITTQIDNYLASTGGTAGADTLYTLWGGANDIFYNSALVGGGLDINTALFNIAGSASALVTQAQRLYSAGAGTILIPNLPDIGEAPISIYTAINVVGAGNPNLQLAIRDATIALRTPAQSEFDQFAVQDAAIAAAAAQLGVPVSILAGYAEDTRDLYSGLTATYNFYLEDFLTGSPEEVILLDIEELFFEALADPAAYGLANVTGIACNTVSSLTCTAAFFASPDADRTYLFADGVHPTTAVHDIIADLAFQELGGSVSVPEPSILFLLGPVFGILMVRRKYVG